MDIKQALDLTPTPESVEIKRQLPNLILKAFLTSAAGAGALRGAYGVARSVNRNLEKRRTSLSTEFPVYVNPGEAPKAKLASESFMEAISRPFRQMGEDVSNAATKPVSDAASYVGKTLKGDNATRLADFPYSGAFLVPPVMLGLYGGWKGVDSLLNARRKQQMQDELDAAKRQYEQALQPAGHKAASDLGKELDELYKEAQTLAETKFAEFAKEATGEAAGSGPDLLGAAINGSLSVAAPLGLLAGLTTYNMHRKGEARRKLLEVAQRQRAQRMAGGGPIFAYPSQLTLPAPQGTSPQEEDEPMKAASRSSMSPDQLLDYWQGIQAANALNDGFKARTGRDFTEEEHQQAIWLNMSDLHPDRYPRDASMPATPVWLESISKTSVKPTQPAVQNKPMKAAGALSGGMTGAGLGILGGPLANLALSQATGTDFPGIGTSMLQGAGAGSLLGAIGGGLSDDYQPPTGDPNVPLDEAQRGAEKMRREMGRPSVSGLGTGLAGGLVGALLGPAVSDNSNASLLGAATVGLPAGLMGYMNKYIGNREKNDVLTGLEERAKNYEKAREFLSAITGGSTRSPSLWDQADDPYMAMAGP